MIVDEAVTLPAPVKAPHDQEYIWSLGRIVDVARYLATASGI